MLRVKWRGLETESRLGLHGHERGNPGHRQGHDLTDHRASPRPDQRGLAFSWERLQHTEWDCRYDIISILKYRRKCSTDSSGGIWERHSGVWPVRRRAESRKGT